MEDLVTSPQRSSSELPKILTNIKSISKLITVILFVIFPFLGFYFGMIYQRNFSESTPNPSLREVDATLPTQQPSTNLGKTGFPDWHLISKKKYKNFEVGSFDFSEITSGLEVPIPSLFVVAPVVNNQPQIHRDSYAVSMIPDVYYNENIFDIVGDKIYIIDSQLNIIKTFTAEYNSPTLVTPEYYYMKYLGSIPPPRYNIGTIISIKCALDRCSIESAFHQESGCEFDLDISTLNYSVPVCHSPGPGGTDYTPEKI